MSCRTRMNVFNENPLIDWFPLFALLSNNSRSNGDCDRCCEHRCCRDRDYDRESDGETGSGRDRDCDCDCRCGCCCGG